MELSRTGASRAARAVAALAVLFFLGTFIRPSERLAPTAAAGGELIAEAVPLHAGEPGRRRAGTLLFVAGYRLRSGDRRFGGISAMHVEGEEVIALGDAGVLLRFPLPRRPGPLPLELRSLRHGAEAGPKGDRDSEAMTVHAGRVWVAFERRNAVRRYRLSDWTYEATAMPAAMRGWPSNSGSEAMLRLPGGRFLLLAEGPVAEDGTSPALLFAGDPALAATAVLPLRYRPPPGHRVTDAAALPDGRLVFLNRRFRLLEGWSAVLTIGEAAALRSGTIQGRELAALRAPLVVDNMEALSVASEGGRTMLWIASDDNFTPMLQQTLLLGFALDE